MARKTRVAHPELPLVPRKPPTPELVTTSIATDNARPRIDVEALLRNGPSFWDTLDASRDAPDDDDSALALGIPQRRVVDPATQD